MSGYDDLWRFTLLLYHDNLQPEQAAGSYEQQGNGKKQQAKPFTVLGSI